MSDTAVCETELKFEIEPQAARALRAHPALAAPSTVERLRSTYFDTPEHDLRNLGLSLRVRQTGSGFVQTVKRRRADAGFGRDEWEKSVSGETPDPASLKDTPVPEALNGDAETLGPVFATAVKRTRRLWNDGSNVVEVSLDEGEISADGEREPIRELELELKAGEPQALFALARDLAGTGAMRLSFESKGERGYRLVGHDGLAAQKAEQAPLTPGMSTADAFRVVARACLAHVAGNARLLRRVRSPQVLHQTRVGIRRLRAALSTFKPILQGPGLDRVGPECRWLAKELDAARDLDVFIQTTFTPVAETAEDDPAVAAFGKRLLHAQADAYDRALAAVESQRFSDLLLQTAEWVEVGDWSQTHKKKVRRLQRRSARAFGAEALDRLAKRVNQRSKSLGDRSPAERHRVRIHAKKLRYTAEMFADAFRGPTDKRRRRYLTALRTLQERLGELNDIAVARSSALKVAGPRSSDLGFAGGMMVGRRQKDQPRLIKAAGKASKALRKAKPFWG